MIHHNHEQGSEAWLAARKGCITGSRFKDCRDKLKNGELSEKAKLYAMDVARERIALASRVLDRFEQERADFHERVRQAYLERAHSSPARIRVIDAQQSIEQIRKLLEKITSSICL